MSAQTETHLLKGQKRARSIRIVLWAILFLNVLVAVAKYLYGLFSHSASMQADGIHSLFDGLGNVVGIVGMTFASRPPDNDHPYGHSKFETYASVVIGLLLLFAAWNVGSTAVSDLVRGQYGATVDAGSFIVMLGTLCINIGVTTWERSQGHKLGSEILVADSSHTLSDVFVSVGVIVGLIFVKLGFAMADSIAALVVACAILYTAYGVFRQANATLSDSARISRSKISHVALAVPGVLGCHHIRTRGSEAEVYVDLHLLVDGSVTVNHGHEIAEGVEEAILEAFDPVVDVVVHVEPCDEKQLQISANEQNERQKP